MVGDTHRAPRGTHVPGVVAVDGEGEGSGTSHSPPEHGAVTEDVAVVDSVWEELGGNMGLEVSPGSKQVSPPCLQHPESSL